MITIIKHLDNYKSRFGKLLTRESVTAIKQFTFYLQQNDIDQRWVETEPNKTIPSKQMALNEINDIINCTEYAATKYKKIINVMKKYKYPCARRK